MGGRSLPLYCKHDVCIDAGDESFEVTAEVCKECKGGTSARSILKDASDAVQARAILRDIDTEKSMGRATRIFNSIADSHVMSEVDGWMFMAVLKIARAQQGKFHLDDYIDAAAYIALAGEAAAKAIEDETGRQSSD